MHPNEALIARFYEAFQRRDAAAMGACYHKDVAFSDEIFPELHGDSARAMWTMLCERGKDLTVTCSNVHADSATGRAQWDAWYTFSGSGRRVHNAIRAEFTFEDGLIVRHVDRFSFWTWARQALGPVGALLGWTGFLRRRVQSQAAHSLRAWGARARTAALLLAALVGVACSDGSPTQPTGPFVRLTTPELLRRLGKPDTARLVIIHGDDIAITPGATNVTLAALRARGVSSASVIVTTPHLAQFSEQLDAASRALDIGVHIAVTSETPAMRWFPAAPLGQVASLVDSSGWMPVGGMLDPVGSEVEVEVGAQVARARKAGFVPTHIDSHQGALLYGGATLFDALRRVAKRECLAIPVPSTLFTRFPYLAGALDDGQPPLADLVSIPPTIPAGGWGAFYDEVFATLRPGVTLLLLHLGEDTPVERIFFRDHTDYNAAWRARDAQQITSGAIAAMAASRGVQVVDWGDLLRVAPIC